MYIFTEYRLCARIGTWYELKKILGLSAIGRIKY